MTIQSLRQKSSAKNPHFHKTGQLSLTLGGVMYVRAETRLFIVPPQMAIFIPKNTSHYHIMRKDLVLNTLYLSEKYTKNLPKKVTLLTITDLAKNLILRITQLKGSDLETKETKRLLATLIDELKNTTVIDYSELPLSDNPIILKVYQQFNQANTTYPSIEELAKLVHISSRTLLRIFKQETGMSFIIWKQRFLFIKALELLQKYGRTNIVAYKLGYNSESAFISMFKKMSAGKLPSDYKG